MLRTLVVSAGIFALTMVAACAQQADLTEDQKLGQRLVTQHCGVCHFRIQINVQSSFGPLLSKATFSNGREGELKSLISNGSPNMPGFKYLLTSAQIDAAVDYLKTINPPGLTGRR